MMEYQLPPQQPPGAPTAATTSGIAADPRRACDAHCLARTGKE
jgi:hypothetical protein